MDKYKRLGKNIVLIFLGNAGSKLLNILLLPFYTHWLSVEDYGVTDMLNVYVILLLGLVTASISEAAFVFPKGEKIEKQKGYFSSGLFVAFVFLGITAFVFFVISSVFNSTEILETFTKNIWYIYIMIVVSFLQNYFQEFNRAIDKMKIYSTSGIILTITTAFFSFLFIPKYGVYGYITSIIFANICSTVYSGVFSKSLTYIKIKSIHRDRYIEMLKYSIPLIPNSIMWWFIGYFNRPLIETYSGIESVGLLAVANKFPTAIVVLFSIFFYSWQVSVLDEFGKKGYQDFYNKIFRFILFFLSIGTISLGIFSKFIITLTTSEDFHKAWVYVPVLALAPLFQSISSFSGTNFSAAKQTKYIFFASFIGGASSVLFNFMLIPIWGIWGAVIAIVLSHICMAILRVYYAWKYVILLNFTSNLVTLFSTICISYALIVFDDIIFKSIIVLVLLLSILWVNRDQSIMLINKIKLFNDNYRRRS